MATNASVATVDSLAETVADDCAAYVESGRQLVDSLADARTCFEKFAADAAALATELGGAA